MTAHTSQSNILAICLPTRDRPRLLSESLTLLIERVRPYNIPIYVSDNSTNSDTSILIKKLQLNYKFLHYSRCEKDFEADENFVRALSLPETKYRWLFGDHYKIVDDFDLNILLSLLSAGYELIALNSKNRIKDIESGKYSDSIFVLEKMGWHLTMMTSLIYSEKLLDRIDFTRYYGTFLTQTLSIFEEFSKKEIDFYWLADIVVGSYPIDPHMSWHPRALSVFVRDWFHGIMSLPPKYGTLAKQTAIMSHASNVSLFSLRGMIYLRAVGAIDLAKIMAVKKEISFVFRLDRKIYLFLSLLVPRLFAKLALKAYEYSQRKNHSRLGTWDAPSGLSQIGVNKIHRIAAIYTTYHPDQDFRHRIRHVIDHCSVVIIVDNTPNGHIFATGQIDGFVLLQDGCNKGLGAALNLGIDEAIRQSCDAVVLFDQDSSPQPDFISSLINGLTAAGPRAVVGPLLFDQVKNNATSNIIKNNMNDQKANVSLVLEDVSFIATSGMGFRLMELTQQEKFTENFFLDFVDYDWCWRLREKGWRIYRLSSLPLAHSLGLAQRSFMGITYHLPETYRHYFQFRDSLKLITRSYVPFLSRVRLFIILLPKLVVYPILLDSGLERLRWMLRGIRDAIRSVPGVGAAEAKLHGNTKREP